jgi:hypothetical protein
MLHVKISQCRRFGFRLGFTNEVFHVPLDTEAKSGNTFVEQSFTRTCHSGRKIAANVETKNSAQNDDAKNEREYHFHCTTGHVKTNMKEKNENGEPAGINVNFKPGSGFREGQEWQFLSRVEKSQRQNEEQKEQAGVNRILSQRDPQ